MLGDGDPRLIELELAAQREHGHDAVCRSVATLDEAEAIAPEHLVLLGGAEPYAGRVRNAGSVFVGPWSPVAAGDYATGGQSRPADERLGALGRRSRPRDVPQAGDDPAPHRGRARAAAADDRGARGGGGHAGSCGGGAQMRAIAPEFRPYAFALPTAEVARLAGIDPSQVAAVRPEHAAAPARLDPARARSPARSRGSAATPPAGTASCAVRSRTTRGVRAGERRARSGGRRPDPALRAGLRRAGRHDRDPGCARPTRSFESRHSSRAPRSATSTRCSPSRAARTTRPASSGRCPTRDRSSSTRRTSSTAA